MRYKLPEVDMTDEVAFVNCQFDCVGNVDIRCAWRGLELRFFLRRGGWERARLL